MNIDKRVFREIAILKKYCVGYHFIVDKDMIYQYLIGDSYDEIYDLSMSRYVSTIEYNRRVEIASRCKTTMYVRGDKLYER